MWIPALRRFWIVLKRLFKYSLKFIKQFLDRCSVIEQLAAKLKYPYYRIPLSGEVRDVTLLGSVQLYGDGLGGTDSKWQDGELTRALRGPSFVNLSELNAAGPEVLFALHSLL